MDDQLDDGLKNHIKKVFDGYDDPSAHEGWLLLREKFPERQEKRRPIGWIWWNAAALLILALGFGLWKYSANNQTDNLAVNKPQNSAVHKNLAVAKQPPAANVVPKPSAITAAQAAATNTTQTAAVTNHAQNASGQVGVTHLNQSRMLYEPPLVRPFTPAKPAAVNDNTANQQLLARQKPDTGKHAVNAPPASQLAAIQPGNRPAIADTAKPAKPKSMAGLLASNNPPREKIRDGSARVRFGVYAGSYFNYSKGSSNQGNLGGGITAEIKLSKKLRLVTGIAIAQNSLNFGGGIPTGAAQSNFFNTPGANGAATTPGPSDFSISKASAITVASVPAFKNYGASMIGIDIPVNLKFDFNPQKNNFYVMAGLSSGTFANETYTYQYNYPAILSPSLQQTQNEVSRKSFNSFYVGKMVNLAFGAGYPLGRNHLILEPFLKFPLDGLGSQNIKFGAGGINLKFNFPTFRK